MYSPNTCSHRADIEGRRIRNAEPRPACGAAAESLRKRSRWTILHRETPQGTASSVSPSCQAKLFWQRMQTSMAFSRSLELACSVASSHGRVVKQHMPPISKKNMKRENGN